MSNNPSKNAVDILEDLTAKIDDLNTAMYEQKLAGSDKHRDFIEKIDTFKHEIGNTVADAKSAIESPIYAGVMGHYSHGKSSVLNALLFPAKSDWLLPMGDGIVTSLCTLIAFNAKGKGDEFLETSKSGDEVHLSKESFSRKASGKISIEDVHYFGLKLDTGNLASQMYSQFANKNIELLDTPGLGGPYWNDEHVMQQWVKEFALLIVCIKADAINQNTAITINPFLKMSSSPVIPVITFWDTWKDAEDFSGISNEKEAKSHAKDLVKKHFPTLFDAADLAQFVSAKNYQLDAETPNDGSISSAWGIDNLRSAISTIVSDKQEILKTIKNRSAGLDLQRKRTVIQRCENMESAFQSFSQQLKEEMEALSPEVAYQEVLDEVIEEVTDKVQREFERIADRLEQLTSDRIGIISKSDAFDKKMNELKKDTQQELQHILADRVTRRLERDVNHSAVRALQRWASKNAPLNNRQLDELEKRLDQASKEFVHDVTSIERIDLISIPLGLDSMAKNYGQILLSIEGLKAAGIFIGGMIIALALSWIPVISSLAYFAAVVIPVFMLWTELGHAQNRTLADRKEKSRMNNKHVDIRSRLLDSIEGKLQSFKGNLNDILNRYIEKPQDTSDEMLEVINDYIDDIDKDVHRLHKTTTELKRDLG